MPYIHEDGELQTSQERRTLIDRIPSIRSIGRGLLVLAGIAYATGEHAVEMAKNAAAEYPLREYPENKDKNN
jgi:hypothetical protein